MTDIRRSVVWLLALVAVTVAGDRLFSAVLRRLLVQSQFRYSRLYRGGNDADVLLLGDSRGVHSFYPPAVKELTGLNAYNLSYNSMSPRIAEAILLDYLDRNRKPRLVIFEVTSLVAKQKLSTELRTYVAMSPRLARLYSEDHPQAAVAARLFGLYPLNSDFYTEALRFMRRSDQDWAFHHTVPLATQNSPSLLWTLKPLETNIAALIRILRVLHERHIETRLVIAPYMRAGMPEKEPEFAAALTARLRAADPNVRLWDYVTAISDPKYFADRVHLNEDGSRLLLSMLQRDGAFANLPRDDKRPGQR